EKDIHGNITFRCTSCEKQYTRKHHLKQHHNKCSQPTTSTSASIDGQIFDQLAASENDFRKLCLALGLPPQNNTPSADAIKEVVNKLIMNIDCQAPEQNNQAGEGDVTSQQGEIEEPMEVIQEEHEPYENEDGTVDEGLRKIYKDNHHIIYSPHRRGKIIREYNFHIPSGSPTLDDFHKQLNEIYQEQVTSFKINLSLAIVLAHRETGQLRYFYAHNNESILQSPTLITDRSDIETIMQKLRELNLAEEIWRQRPDTKWIPYRVVNTRWSVYGLDFPLGTAILLPDYIRKNKAIVSLNKKPYRAELYKDNLCAFRCLAYHKTKSIVKLHPHVDPLVQKWKEVTEKQRICGVTLKEMPLFEDTFKININIHSIDKDRVATKIYTSTLNHNDTMNLNQYDKHLSYITNMGMYSRKYRCRNCDKLFDRTTNLKRHESKCKEATAFKFPGGYYNLNPSLFEKLESNGYDTS
ncbi:unnamed protein product, partial [Owenia fusiformis]